MSKIDIVCTDRGKHQSWRVGFVLEVMERSPVGAGCEIMRDPDGSRTGVRLTCGRCPRAPQLRWHRWRVLVAGLDESDLSTVDISRLPF